MRDCRAMVLAIAALLVCCSADAPQAQKEHSTVDADGYNPYNLDLRGGFKLIRDKRESPQLPYPMASSNRIKRDPAGPPPVEYVEPNPNRWILKNGTYVLDTEYFKTDSPVTEDDLSVLPLGSNG